MNLVKRAIESQLENLLGKNKVLLVLGVNTRQTDPLPPE
jgi:hypothetical protein